MRRESLETPSSARRLARHAALAALCCWGLASPAWADEPQPSAPSSSEEEDLELRQVEENIIHLTNLEREKRGLPPLRVDAELMDSARRHARWMVRAQSLTHTSAPVAENIAMGQDTSKEAVRAWMNSSGHRANILGRYRRIGVAAFRGRNGRIYWCQQFTR